MLTTSFPRPAAFPLAALAWLAALVAEPARAETLVTFHFGGVIYESETVFIEEGTRFSGTLAYDLDAFDEEPDDPTYGFYDFPLPESAPVQFTYTVGEMTYVADDEAYLIIFNDDPGDSFIFDSDRAAGVGLDFAQIFLVAVNDDVFSSDRPPGTLNLNDFAIAELSGTYRVPPPGPGQPGADRWFYGTIDTLTIVSVPEPNGLVLMGMGGLGALFVALRRARGVVAPTIH